VQGTNISAHTAYPCSGSQWQQQQAQRQTQVNANHSWAQHMEQQQLQLSQMLQQQGAQNVQLMPPASLDWQASRMHAGYCMQHNMGQDTSMAQTMPGVLCVQVVAVPSNEPPPQGIILATSTTPPTCFAHCFNNEGQNYNAASLGHACFVPMLPEQSLPKRRSMRQCWREAEARWEEDADPFHLD